MITSLRSGAELAAVARARRVELADASAEEILRWAADEFGSGLAVTASMQDTVLVHLASKALPGIDVLFLETGYHFIETIGTADAVEAVYDVTLRRLLPLQTVAEQDAQYGKDLFARDPDLCCALRKVAPLNRALTGLRGVGHRGPPGRVAHQGEHPGRRVRRQARKGQDRAAGRLVRRRRRRLHRQEQRPGQPAAERRLPLDRLRAVYPAGVAGAGFPGRPLGRPGQDRMWDQYMTTIQNRPTQP